METVWRPAQASPATPGALAPSSQAIAGMTGCRGPACAAHPKPEVHRPLPSPHALPALTGDHVRRQADRHAPQSAGLGSGRYLDSCGTAVTAPANHWGHASTCSRARWLPVCQLLHDAHAMLAELSRPALSCRRAGQSICADLRRPADSLFALPVAAGMRGWVSRQERWYMTALGNAAADTEGYKGAGHRPRTGRLSPASCRRRRRRRPRRAPGRWAAA